MKRTKPDGHTLYWIYVNYQDGAYNFDTTTRKDEAMAIATAFRDEPDWESVFMHWGDEDGAFTDVDPVATWYR